MFEHWDWVFRTTYQAELQKARTPQRALSEAHKRADQHSKYRDKMVSGVMKAAGSLGAEIPINGGESEDTDD